MPLPFWNSDLDLSLSSWFPLGVDYKSVSINSLYSVRLKNVAALSLALDSEFFFMSSLKSGYVGNMLRENLFSSEQRMGFNLGFVFLVGYSRRMEELVERQLKDKENESLKAGITWCALRRGDVLLASVKSIALVSEDIFFDEEAFLERFAVSLGDIDSEDRKVPFYAEKFGFRRFSIPYETDNMTDMYVSRLLSEMEFSVTKEATGPSPEINFPFFIGTEFVVSRS